MPAVCTHGRPCEQSILPGCWNKTKESECKDTRETTKLFQYSLRSLNHTVVHTHKGCVCNEKVALQQRHQVDDGARADPVECQRLKRVLKRHITRVIPASRQGIVNHYTGTKRREMEVAAASLEQTPVEKRDSMVRMFLKADKYHGEVSAPRCIQFRTKRYCMELARFLHPAEEAFYQQQDEYETYITAKSRNLTQRAADLRAKWESFSDPVAILADHSKFDAHCSQQLLAVEHWFHKQCVSNADGRSKLAMLLSWQLDNRGNTRNGTTFRTKGTRMSGDQNTGYGNTILNYGMLKSWLLDSKVGGSIYVDGDDSVIICERLDLPKLDGTYFSRYGMKTKIDYGFTFEEVEFCQTRPVFDGHSWRMVRNPERVLARLPWIVKKLPQNCHLRYLKSVGLCEVALSLGLPVMQAIGWKLATLTSAKYMMTDGHYQASKEFIKPWNVVPLDVSIEARQSYERAWGLTIQEQLQLEAVEVEFSIDDPMPLFIDQIGERPFCG